MSTLGVIRSLYLIALTSAIVAAADPLPLYPIDEKLDGPPSLFTDVLLQLSKRWPEG